MNNAIILLDPREGCVDGVGALPGAGPGHLELELQAKIAKNSQSRRRTLLGQT